MRKSVGQAPTVEQENKRNEKTCRTSSDIGAEQENYVGRGPTLDRKRLMFEEKYGSCHIVPVACNTDLYVYSTFFFP
jgi:hypothetical protein